DEHRPGLAQPANAGGVASSDALRPQLRSRGCRPIEHVEDILDAERNTVQRPAPLPRPDLGSGTLRLGPGQLPIDKHPGLYSPFEAINALEAILEKLKRCRLSPDQRLRCRVNRREHFRLVPSPSSLVIGRESLVNG